MLRLALLLRESAPTPKVSLSHVVLCHVGCCGVSTNLLQLHLEVTRASEDILDVSVLVQTQHIEGALFQVLQRIVPLVGTLPILKIFQIKFPRHVWMKLSFNENYMEGTVY